MNASNLDNKSSATEQPLSAVVARSEELLRGGKELIILHQGAAYRLTVTRNGKLILTK